MYYIKVVMEVTRLDLGMLLEISLVQEEVEPEELVLVVEPVAHTLEMVV